MNLIDKLKTAVRYTAHTAADAGVMAVGASALGYSPLGALSATAAAAGSGLEAIAGSAAVAAGAVGGAIFSPAGLAVGIAALAGAAYTGLLYKKDVAGFRDTLKSFAKASKKVINTMAIPAYAAYSYGRAAAGAVFQDAPGVAADTMHLGMRAATVDWMEGCWNYRQNQKILRSIKVDSKFKVPAYFNPQEKKSLRSCIEDSYRNDRDNYYAHNFGKGGTELSRMERLKARFTHAKERMDNYVNSINPPPAAAAPLPVAPAPQF